MKNLEKVISALELAVSHDLDCMLTTNDCAVLLGQLQKTNQPKDNNLEFLDSLTLIHPYDLSKMLETEKSQWRRRMIKYQIKLDLEDARQLEAHDHSNSV